MRALEIQRLEEERKSRMKTAAEAKKERERKLANMTEEEKEEFYEEEKEQKKVQWAKKQVRQAKHKNKNKKGDGVWLEPIILFDYVCCYSSPSSSSSSSPSPLLARFNPLIKYF